MDPFDCALCVSQRHGEPLFIEPQPAEQRGRPVQLPHHLAGVRGGPGLLEGPAAAGGHRPPLARDRLLRQRRAAFLQQPAGAGSLRGGMKTYERKWLKMNEVPRSALLISS